MNGDDMHNKFDMIIKAPRWVRQQADVINDHYFTIDTADQPTVNEWIDFNPLIVTYALHGDHVMGFFNIVPITTECARLFDQQELKEEDLAVEHILPPAAMRHAKYAYLAGIAIKDTRDFCSRQCTAALIAAISDHLLHAYDINVLERLYTNPTTFDGNHMVRKLGLRPVTALKKTLKENDIYALEITGPVIAGLRHFSQRYACFVAANPWTQNA